MRTIAVAAVLALCAASAAAQDWERFYPLAERPPAGAQVLVIDPAVPRGDDGRYQRLALTAPGAGILYRAATTRFNRAIVIDMGAAQHPAAGTLAFIRLPARVDGDDADRVVVRTDTDTGTVRQHASALVNRGGGQLTWGELSGRHWVLIGRTGEWVLLD